ncbi:2-nitropropane dioxygenase [Lindgomyces ingoldianus]|uniref:2-nitropropane dioxygenase n=1 Tax=Lindgomyces ingoldianus TaxID=673940 RepID=A0ACB6QMA7_9PLEO|nr:2-nitropropane dioxygenase [Lindgomyces ingoldianus]KAF2467255.1 2-nitropropane dioxygenase [Lindgomyces ingoldianus]
MATAPLSTPLTSLLGVKHPVMLAGMDQVAGPELAAAVCNAGGFGTLGGARYTPRMLREMIAELKENLMDKNAPFGVDLLIPQVGGSARKTNYDYTKGNLGELLDIVIESGAKLFVSAVGVPPKWAIEKLHKAGVLYMNMIGHPKHVHKACQAGADLICAQGGEAGGHTGDIPTSVLIPACADICKQYQSPLTKQPVTLVAAGGINDGRSVAAALMLGASGVWVGTRFITSVESKAPATMKKEVIEAGYDSWVKSIVWSGRPLRALRNPYIDDWENNRQAEIKDLASRGIVPLEYELDRLHKEGKLTDEIEEAAALRPIGIVAGSVNKAGQTAAEIVKEMVDETVVALNQAGNFVNTSAKL